MSPAAPAAPADTRYPKPARATPPLHREATIGLLYLTRWPALPAQLTERDRLVHRICTLLSSKPRASHLIHLLVQAPKDDVQAALRTLLQTGCVHIGHSATESGSARRPQATRDRDRNPAPAADTDAAVASAHPSVTAAATPSVSAASPTLPASPATRLGKLWSRLSA